MMYNEGFILPHFWSKDDCKACATGDQIIEYIHIVSSYLDWFYGAAAHACMPVHL